VDDSASHASFAKKYNLNFPLLADRKGETARIYLSASASRNSFEVIEGLKKMKGS
jgi:peroxiredoxin Q/BCP